MVASQHHRSGELSLADGLVEGQGNLGAALAVGIEDAGLGTYYQVVAAGFLNPVDVVPHLAGNLCRGVLRHLGEHLHGQGVRLGQVFRLLAHAHPAERAKTVVKVHGAHDVLHIGRVAEAAVGLQDIGPGAGAFQKKGVAIIEEIHPFRCQLVNGRYLPPQRCLHGAAEGVGV